jgi:DNA replication and repair protein RecF
MRINRLSLENFKNYEKASLNFDKSLCVIAGLNGSGKTNVLEAIHYLSLTKGTFNPSDSQNIKKGTAYFKIEGLFERINDEPDQVMCYYDRSKGKIIRHNHIDVQKFSEHIGKFLIVLSTPLDQDIIYGGSEIRRKWIDGILSQLDPVHLSNLMVFQKILKQRNQYLKQCDGRVSKNGHALLDSYDQQLIPLGQKISEYRESFLVSFLPDFTKSLSRLVPENEQCVIKMKSEVLQHDFIEKYTHSREKDIAIQRTTMGAHRDDFQFILNDEILKRFGSQGQQKSFLIALKLAQFDYIHTQKNQKPLILLDDIFDKLDDTRIRNLIEQLSDVNRFGQVIITDARKERSTKILAKHEFQLIEISNGTTL